MEHRRTLALVCLAGAMILPGCVYYPAHHRGHGHGPPVYVPHDGYRYWHRDRVELSWDASLGLYVVLGHPSYYYHRDRFYRRAGPGWQASVHFRGPWWGVELHHLPPGLRGRGPRGRR